MLVPPSGVPLAFAMNLPGAAFFGLILGALFGVPLAAIRAALPGAGTRSSRFGQTLAIALVGGAVVMVLFFVIGP